MKNVIDLLSEKVSCWKKDLEYITGEIEIIEIGLKRESEEREERFTLIDECKKAIEIFKGKSEFDDLALGLLERIHLLEEQIKQNERYIEEVIKQRFIYLNGRSKDISEIKRLEKAIKLLAVEVSFSSILDKVSAEME